MRHLSMDFSSVEKIMSLQGIQNKETIYFEKE